MVSKKKQGGFRKADHSCTIAGVGYVYANSCRPDRHSEGPKDLLTSRGRVMAASSKAQSFEWPRIDLQEAPSTA
jgi:hypothetical protein